MHIENHAHIGNHAHEESPVREDTEVRGFARFLYTQNPFYLISACLVLYGLHVSFGDAGSEPWSLALALCGYTCLMALTAVVLIRLGKVWDDARSIMLILLLLFLAISASFDEVCHTDYFAAARVLLCGLAFSVLVTEGLFHCLRIRFPLVFRVPYYLLLGLLFVYPLWLAQPDVSKEAIAWRIFLFPVIAAASSLTLIPAIRCGSQIVQQNGTPWCWPLYPWSVFFVLGVGVCLRAFGMSLSFDPAPSIALYGAFGLFYLVPFLFAVLLLIVEIGVVEKLETVKRFALTTAPLLIVLSMPLGQNKAFTGFLDLFAEAIGSPIYLTWIGLLVFYVFCLARGLRGAESWLCAALVPAMFIDRYTYGPATLAAVQWWPLVVIGGIQLLRAIERRESLRCFAAIVTLSLAVSIAFWDGPLRLAVIIAAYHLVCLAALLISFEFNDGWGKELRLVAAVMIGLAGILAVVAANTTIVPNLACMTYIAAMAIVTMQLWRRWRELCWLVVTGSNLIILVLACLSVSGETLHSIVGSPGFYPLLWGILFFIVAGLISAQKCGLLKHIWEKFVRIVLDSPPSSQDRTSPKQQT